MPAIIMAILSLISSARGGNPAGATGLSQLGSLFGSLSDGIGSKSKSNPNLSERGYPSSRYGY